MSFISYFHKCKSLTARMQTFLCGMKSEARFKDTQTLADFLLSLTHTQIVTAGC